MKKIITLLAASFIAAAAYAQTDSLVTFDTQGDRLGISIAGFNIALGEEAQQPQKVRKPKRVSTNLAGLSFGLNALGNKPLNGAWEGSDAFNDVGGWRFGMEALGIQVALDRNNTVFIKAGLCASIDTYRFHSPVTLFNDEDGRLMPARIEGNVKKSKMVALYWGCSAGLGFRISKVKVLFDASAEILTDSYVKYKNPGKTRYDITGLNPILYKAGASVTVHDIGIYADYSINPIFRSGTGNDNHLLSIGVQFGF